MQNVPMRIVFANPIKYIIVVLKTLVAIFSLTFIYDDRLLQQLMGQELSTASSSQLRVKFSDDLPTTQLSQKLKSSKMRKAMRSEVCSS